MKPETIDELKVALQTIWGELPPQEHINKAMANFTKRLTAAWLPVVINSSTCSNSVSLQVCILISAPKTGSFQSHPHAASENNVRNAEN